jgi:Rod binding domain-containing protein
VTPLGSIGAAASAATTAATAATAAAAATPAPGSQAARIHDAAVKFEGLFMSQLVDRMLESSGVGASQPVYSGLISEKLGDHLATVGGIGLAALIEGQVADATSSAGKGTP